MKLGFRLVCFLCFSVGAVSAGEVTVLDVAPNEALSVGATTEGQPEVRLDVSPSGDIRHFVNREIVQASDPPASAVEEESAND